MAWTTVETPNAKYVLIFSAHAITAEQSPENFDCIVLESGIITKAKTIIEYKQFKKNIQIAIERDKPIWLTDCAPVKKNVYRELAITYSELAVALAGGIILHSGKGKTKRRTFLKKTIGIGALFPFLAEWALYLPGSHQKEIQNIRYWNAKTKIDEIKQGKGTLLMRNLLTAEKCESWLAPRMQQELGRKPVIAMVWGSAHFRIRNLLLHPERRRKLLEQYDLGRFLEGDYKKSVMIKLNPDGTIRKIEEFPDTLSQQRRRQESFMPRKSEPMSRRQLLSRAFGRIRK